MQVFARAGKKAHYLAVQTNLTQQKGEIMTMQNTQVWNNAMTEVMEIPAYLDNSTAIYFEEDALLCITSGARDMVLDASKLDYLTAGGTRALMAIAKAMKEMEGTLSIRNLRDQARDMFNACGLPLIISEKADEEADSVQTTPHLSLVA